MEKSFKIGDIVCLKSEVFAPDCTMVVNNVLNDEIECIWYSKLQGEYKTFKFKPAVLIPV
jgi:uncharacterized protein YodC (DUF2158 family)